jgi:non-specific serine/threonine protein kinase/serine/threonine-protein kinase
VNQETLKSLFFEASTLPPRLRERFIRERCAGDRDLRKRLQQLIDANDDAGEFMAEPTTGVFERLDKSTPGVERPPSTIGPYAIERMLGEGGYGAVYLARQDAPVRRHVALKVIKPGMDSRQVILRFEAERQTLALMDHPSIARVLDAGATEQGRPYFVMELVHAEPITRYCDRRRLDIPSRLRLLEQVAGAVQHAHQKGVIHRDLKPSNILVTEVDGAPFPKIIDFGIAKALAGGAEVNTAITQARQVVGTLQYMSPEQATGDESVDTRSDVYSLGVLLYELLVGSPPFDADRLRSASFAEVERIITQEEPPRPSAAATSLADRAASIARARRLDPDTLVRTLKGELDWIVMRAMAKEQSRRYPAASAFGADIGRYLRNEPVEAGPPSRSYRMAKFARRHRVAIVTTAVFFLALGAMLIGSVQFGIRADRQRRAAEAQLTRANALADFAQSIISSVDPAIARDADTTLLERILAEATDRVNTELKDHPAAGAAMLNTIGYTHLQLADYPAAERDFRRAYALGRDALGETAQETLDAQGNLAAAYLARSDFAAAEPVLLSVIAARSRRDGPTHLDTLEVRSNLAYLYNETGRYEKARAEFEEVLTHRRRHLGRDNEKTVASMNNLAVVLHRLGEAERAIPLFEAVIDNQKRTLGPDHPRTLATRNNLADSYVDLGLEDEAEQILRDVIDIKLGIMDPDHPSIVISRHNLANLYMGRHRFDEAVALLEPAVESARRTLGELNMITITATNGLSAAERGRANLDRAESLALDVLRKMREVVGPDHPSEAHARANLAKIYADMGRIDDALIESAEAERIAHAHFEPLAPGILGVEICRASILSQAGQTDLAETRLIDAHRASVLACGKSNRRTRESVEALAELYERTGDQAEAQRWRDELTGG